MKTQSFTYKALILRGLYPPQFSLCSIASTFRFPINIVKSPLLRRLTARAAGLVASASFLCTLTSCEKEVTLTPMYKMYEESVALPDAQLDSIDRFTTKFNKYVRTYPESREDTFYEPTVENVREALSLYGREYEEVNVSFTIVVDTTWEKVTHLTY